MTGLALNVGDAEEEAHAGAGTPPRWLPSAIRKVSYLLLLDYTNSASSFTKISVASHPRHGSVIDRPYSPPSTGCDPSSK